MKLAINGGTRLVPEGTFRGWPIIADEDKRAVLDVLDGGELWGTRGKNVSALERDWAAYVGTRHCLAVNSGTAALHIAVAAAGVEPGDEVITSPFTFLASASAVLHHMGIPVFADIDPRTLTIDPKRIEERITARTKAIIPVHIGGLPADMAEIAAIAREHGLVVIEDACQAHGAEYLGKKAGSLGDMAAFSLNATKNLPGGEGGLFNTDSEVLNDKADMVRSFGEIPTKPGARRSYDAYGMGWMYRTQEMAAAFARSQLKRLDRYNALRTENARALIQRLKQVSGIVPPFTPPDRTHVYHMFFVRFDPDKAGSPLAPRQFRMAVEEAMKAEGVPIGQWQTMPVPAQTLFRLRQGYGKGYPWSLPSAGKVSYDLDGFPETLRLMDDYTNIPWVFPPNTVAEMGLIADALEKVFDNLDELNKIDLAKASAVFREW